MISGLVFCRGACMVLALVAMRMWSAGHGVCFAMKTRKILDEVNEVA